MHATDLFVRFVEFYRFAHRGVIYDNVPFNQSVVDSPVFAEGGYWALKPEFRLPLAVLNNGDCFIAALAVGEVLRLQGVEVQYHSNGGHFFLSTVKKNRFSRNQMRQWPVYFDTLCPLGVRDEKQMLQHPNQALYRFESGDAQWLVERALEDAIDIEFIEQFVRFYDSDYRFPYAVPKVVNKNQWFYVNN